MAEPALAYAVSCGREELIELLIDNGTDINMKYKGRTTLHWVCYYCIYSTFSALLRCAEEKIDWNARTPEGLDALDLFDMGVSEGYASDLISTQVDEFRFILVSHMDPSQLHEVEDRSLDIPGAFPVDIKY
ncbi:hypothetical protein BC629DRAFT_1452198 [Irpex lacteus]|nr:hypothetical protein BC629DRAFT_1452198 [Irpex lacteus]